MKTKWIFLCAGFFAAGAGAEPLLTSWLTANAGVYAREYTNTANRTSGSSRTTWVGQTNVCYADVSEVSYSATMVYVHRSGLASYVMGPSLSPGGGVGTFWPQNQSDIAKIPRTPVVKSGTKQYVPAGLSGIFVNGVATFNSLDGKAWDGSGLVGSQHFKTNYFWFSNAPVNESYNFDYGLAHQTPGGVYHAHQQPLALRYQLGDHASYNTVTKNYSEDTNAVTAHSPIIGWALDGYPIYGPYGYSVATNANSGVRRMVSGYVIRDGTGGTDNVATNRSIIPAWYARFRQDIPGNGSAPYTTTASISRPTTNASSAAYPRGIFAQDYEYQGDLGATQGVTTNFDLDVYNGRTCVTPEYPTGTYAYFITLDSSGNAAYPYVFGFEFYGAENGASGVTISEPVTTNFTGGANTALKLTTTATTTNSTISIVWSATEGGTYAVETTANFSMWTTNNSGIAAVMNSGTVTVASTSNGFYRVRRTALATYEQ